MKENWQSLLLTIGIVLVFYLAFCLAAILGNN